VCSEASAVMGAVVAGIIFCFLGFQNCPCYRVVFCYREVMVMVFNSTTTKRQKLIILS
jgi:hypothetical protein